MTQKQQREAISEDMESLTADISHLAKLVEIEQNKPITYLIRMLLEPYLRALIAMTKLAQSDLTVAERREIATTALKEFKEADLSLEIEE